MKTHEIEEGDTVIIKHYIANAEYKLEKVDIIKTKVDQMWNELKGEPVNFLKITLGSLNFNIKSATKINLEDEEETTCTTHGAN